VPAGSDIAVASREEAGLPLPRWRDQGLVHEVGVADLRLGEREPGLLIGQTWVGLDRRRERAMAACPGAGPEADLPVPTVVRCRERRQDVAPG
jgi:hypothetical protein